MGRTNNQKSIGKKTFLVIVFIYLFIPILATVLFSVAGKWDVTVIPESFTLKYYQQIFTDPQFISSLLRSVEICVVSSLITVIVIVPCVYMGVIRYRKLITLFEIFAMVPFIMPGVVLAIGLIQMYSSMPIDITGTIWILMGSYFVICLPYTFQSVRNSFTSVAAKRLVEAAKILGCGETEAFIKVVLPNIMIGVVSSLLLNISILFGDFVLVNLLIGSGYSTVQIYLYQQLKVDGHVSSAIVSVYLITILAISLLAVMLTSKNGRKMRTKR
jgi:putative spermidine/putrescine transport system permease protein